MVEACMKLGAQQNASIREGLGKEITRPVGVCPPKCDLPFALIQRLWFSRCASPRVGLRR